LSVSKEIAVNKRYMNRYSFFKTIKKDTVLILMPIIDKDADRLVRSLQFKTEDTETPETGATLQKNKAVGYKKERVEYNFN
jgi:hypothetical protein